MTDKYGYQVFISHYKDENAYYYWHLDTLNTIKDQLVSKAGKGFN